MVRHVASLAGERFGDRAALAERLRQLHADLDIDVVVRDLDGRVVAAAGRALPPLSDRQAATVRAGTVVVDSHPTWRAAAPVRDPQTRAIVGTLEGATPRRFGGPRLLWPVLAVTAILLVVAAATRPLARRISRPLERLTEAARRLGQGDLGVRAPDPRAPSSRRWTRRFSPDVDELRELTRSFNDMADRVERLVRGQRELLANVSHELRSPLARIRVALALLPQDGDNERRVRDVESDLAELDRLIEDVLTTSRLDATGLPVHLAAVDPNEILTQVAERARHDPVVAGREVRVIPGPSTPVIADAALLRRALWNLVDNAVKYGAPPITLALTRQEDRVSFSVTDEGAGHRARGAGARDAAVLSQRRPGSRHSWERAHAGRRRRAAAGRRSRSDARSAGGRGPRRRARHRPRLDGRWARAGLPRRHHDPGVAGPRVGLSADPTIGAMPMSRRRRDRAAGWRNAV